MSEFVTWEALGGYAGAVMMVTLITQFLKGTPLGKWSSQLVAYVIAVVLLIGAEIFGGQPVTVQGGHRSSPWYHKDGLGKPWYCFHSGSSI